VFENVPAYVCDECGQVSIDGIVLNQIDTLISSGKVAPAPVTDYGELVTALRDQFFGTIDAVQKRNYKVFAKRIAEDVNEAITETRRTR
jgi:hypothetical protein